MENEFLDLVTHYTNKYTKKIKNICQPLEKVLGISYFDYYRIDAEGRMNILSNNPEQLEFYFQHNLFMDEPFFRHPDLFRSGYAFIPAIIDPYFSEINKEKFGFENVLIVLEKSYDSIEGFLFTFQGMTQSHLNRLINDLEVLHQFNQYFKKEAKTILSQMEKHHLSIQEKKGQGFFLDDSEFTLASSNLEVKEFLNRIGSSDI